MAPPIFVIWVVIWDMKVGPYSGAKFSGQTIWQRWMKTIATNSKPWALRAVSISEVF
jgi:hypothetical protein